MAIKKDRFDANDRNNQIYSDFLNDLNPHPVMKDVVRYVNEASINRSIRNLLSTNRGERLYQPNIGSDINKLLFEPMDNTIAELISIAVSDTIRQHEPRAKVIKVDVKEFQEQNAYLIDVYYMIINRSDPVQLTVTLSRVR